MRLFIMMLGLSMAMAVPPGAFKLTKLSYMLRPNDYNGEVSVDAALGDDADVMFQWEDVVTYGNLEYGLPIMGDGQRYTFVNQWYNQAGSFKQATINYSPVPHYPSIPLKLVAETSVQHLKYDIDFNLETSSSASRPTVVSLRELPELLQTPGPQIHVPSGHGGSEKHTLEVIVKPGSEIYFTYDEGLPGDFVNPRQTYIIDDWENIIEGQESNHFLFVSAGNLKLTLTTKSGNFGMKVVTMKIEITKGAEAASGQYTLHVKSSTQQGNCHTEVSFEVLKMGQASRFPASPVRVQISTATEPNGVEEQVTWEMGHPDVIYCTGYSYPAPHLMLTKDGWPVGSGDGHYVFITSSADHSSLSFVIQQVDDGYSGTYECVASTSDGKEYTKTLTVEVV